MNCAVSACHWELEQRYDRSLDRSVNGDREKVPASQQEKHQQDKYESKPEPKKRKRIYTITRRTVLARTAAASCRLPPLPYTPTRGLGHWAAVAGTTNRLLCLTVILVVAQPHLVGEQRRLGLGPHGRRRAPAVSHGPKAHKRLHSHPQHGQDARNVQGPLVRTHRHGGG